MMEIKDILPETEILAQLAEEAAELAQAALKLRRVLDGTNPIPVTETEARRNLVEECADVLNCLNYALDLPDKCLCEAVRKQKMRRWRARLKSKQKDGDTHDT